MTSIYDEYVEKAGRRPARPVLIEVGIRTTDHPDGTGYAWLRDRSVAATRQRDLAAERGRLSWRLLLRASYRTAIASPEGSDELYDALGDLIATAESWRTALRRRPPNTTEEEIDPA